MSVNALRSHLSEFGIIIAKGIGTPEFSNATRMTGQGLQGTSPLLTDNRAVRALLGTYGYFGSTRPSTSLGGRERSTP
jgi:hypothetical protein